MSVKGMRRYGCQPTSLTGFGGFGEIFRFYLLFFVLFAILTTGSLMVTFTCFPFSSSLTTFEGSVATYFEYLSCKPSGYEHGIHGMAKQQGFESTDVLKIGRRLPGVKISSLPVLTAFSS